MSNRGAGAVRAPFARVVLFPYFLSPRRRCDSRQYSRIPAPITPYPKNNVTGSNVIVQYFGS